MKNVSFSVLVIFFLIGIKSNSQSLFIDGDMIEKVFFQVIISELNSKTDTIYSDTVYINPVRSHDLIISNYPFEKGKVYRIVVACDKNRLVYSFKSGIFKRQRSIGIRFDLLLNEVR